MTTPTCILLSHFLLLLLLLGSRQCHAAVTARRSLRQQPDSSSSLQNGGKPCNSPEFKCGHDRVNICLSTKTNRVGGATHQRTMCAHLQGAIFQPHHDTIYKCGPCPIADETTEKMKQERVIQVQEETDLRSHNKCFNNTDELRQAVNIYYHFHYTTGAIHGANGAAADYIHRLYGPAMNDWCVHHIADFSNLFYRKVAFNEPLHNWHMHQARDVSGMFQNCFRFNQDLSKWNMTNVKDAAGMFALALSFSQDLSSWDMPKLASSHDMFLDALEFNVLTQAPIQVRSELLTTSGTATNATTSLTFVAPPHQPRCEWNDYHQEEDEATSMCHLVATATVLATSGSMLG